MPRTLPMPSCLTCRYVDTFHPRPDKVAHDLRLGCRYPGYEGYTMADTPRCGGVFYRPAGTPIREEPRHEP